MITESNVLEMLAIANRGRDGVGSLIIHVLIIIHVFDPLFRISRNASIL